MISRYQNVVSVGYHKFSLKFTNQSSLGLELDVEFPIFDHACHGWLKPTESQHAGMPCAADIYSGKLFVDIVRNGWSRS